MPKVINPPSMFSINMEMVLRGPLQDQRVRKALNLAIDREGITKGILGGLGTPSVGMVGPGTQDELRKTFPPIPFDPEGAKKLLAEAGYKPGRLVPELHLPDRALHQGCAGLPSHRRLFREHRHQGDARSSSTAAHGARSSAWIRPARTDNMGMVGRATAGMDYTLYRLFFTGVGANRTGYSNPRVDELLTEGRRYHRSRQAEGDLRRDPGDHLERAPFVFLWYQTQALGVANRVQGLEVQPNETLVFDKVAREMSRRCGG